MNCPPIVSTSAAFAPFRLRALASAFAIFALNASLVPAQPATMPAIRLKTTETRIASLENAVVQNQRRVFRVSADCNHVAVLVKKGDKYAVAVDGVEGKPYEWIVADTVAFTSDARPIYIVQQGGKMFLVK
jgi:hypothetical protein